MDGRPGAAPGEAVSDDDVLWLPVPPGSVQYGASYGAEAAGDLLMDAPLWQRMVDPLYRLLTAVDRWIEQVERAHEDRTAAGTRAGEAVRASADPALLASIGRPGGGAGAAGGPAAGDDATYAVCRRVAAASGSPRPSRRRARPGRATASARWTHRARVPGPYPCRTARRGLVAQ